MIQDSITLSDLKNSPQYDLLNKLTSNEYLNDFLYPEQSEPDDDDVDIKCQYVEDDIYIKQFKSNENLSFLSLNIQSLPAKYNELKDFLETLDYSFDFICLQEIWRIQDENLYRLPGYNFVHKCRSNNTQGSRGHWYLYKGRLYIYSFTGILHFS